MSPLWRFSPLPLLFVHLHLQSLIEICIPTHPWPSYRPSVSHCWREKDLVFSQCSGSQEQYRIIDYSPTKRHQQEQRANTYPFEQLRFFIHSGLILFALTLWESHNWASRTSSCVVFLLLFFFMMIFFFRCIDHFIIDFVGVGFILLHSFLEFFKQVFIHLNCFQLSSYFRRLVCFRALKKHPHILRSKKVTSCLKLLVISSKVQSKSWPKWLI